MSPQNSSTPAASTQRGETLKSLLAKPATIERIAEIAPKYLNPERLIRIMLLTVSRDGKLMRCTPQSLLAALMRVALFGLEPDGRLAYLVPYKDTVQVIVGWMGLVEVARRNGIECNATLVYDEDDFELMPDDGSGRCFLKHTVNCRNPRTKIVGAYSRCRRIDGTGQVDYEWMSLAEIEAIRKRSQAANSGPWVTDFGEMARKTVLRRHSKRWPLCAEDRAATEDDDAPPEILEKREVISQPARPIFRRQEQIEDEDDLPYNSAVPSAVDLEPATEAAPKDEIPKASATKAKKSKVEEAPVELAMPVPEENFRANLRTWVETDCGADFPALKLAMDELGWGESAVNWKSFADITEEEAATLLRAHKTLGRAIQMIVKGDQA